MAAKTALAFGTLLALAAAAAAAATTTTEAAEATTEELEEADVLLAGLGRGWRPGAGAGAGTEEPECPMHRLGHLNGVLGVTSGCPLQQPLLQLDLALARASGQGCSVLDGAAAPLVLPHVNLRLYYGLGEDDYVAAPVGHASSLLQDPHFNSSRCIAVYAFGYTSSPDDFYTRAAVTALVAANKFTVLLVDWSAANNYSYELSVDFIDHVSLAVARDLKSMVKGGASLCIVSGHSLGGQMTGYISRHLKRLGELVPCAIAMDPAAPLFEGSYYGCARRVQRGDAGWVVVMHSDICGLGILRSHGDVDFYPNSGYHGQPGCPGDAFDRNGTPVGACSHVRAVLLFAEGVRNGLALPGRKCQSWEAFNAGRCDGNDILYFPQCSKKIPGSYFMNTTGEDPLQSTNPPAG